jgi:hypothetical protein
MTLSGMSFFFLNMRKDVCGPPDLVKKKDSRTMENQGDGPGHFFAENSI